MTTLWDNRKPPSMRPPQATRGAASIESHRSRIRQGTAASPARQHARIHLRFFLSRPPPPYLAISFDSMSMVCSPLLSIVTILHVFVKQRFDARPTEESRLRLHAKFDRKTARRVFRPRFDKFDIELVADVAAPPAWISPPPAAILPVWRAIIEADCPTSSGRSARGCGHRSRCRRGGRARRRPARRCLNAPKGYCRRTLAETAPR